MKSKITNLRMDSCFITAMNHDKRTNNMTALLKDTAVYQTVSNCTADKLNL